MLRKPLLGLVLFLVASAPLLAQPPTFAGGGGGGSADPLTVLGPAGVCADQQIALWNGASNTSLQCSVLTVADTTGNLTGPAGGFSIIGGTGAADVLTLDGSLGVSGNVLVTPSGAVRSTSYMMSTIGFVVDGDSVLGSNNAGIFGKVADSTEKLQITWGDASAAEQIAQGSGAIDQRSTETQQSYRIYNTADAAGHTLTNYERLTLTGVAGASVDIKAETAGTGADSLALNLSGEGPAGTVVLDGSDDVAGSVTVTGAGGIQSGADVYRIGSSGYFVVGANGSDTTGAYFGKDAVNGYLYLMGATIQGNSTDVVINKPIRWIRKVTPDIDGETTTLANSATLWTNTGDGDGEAITLLNDPTIGVQYCFAVDVAQTITVAPSTGETLYYGTDQCVASLTSNAIGSTLCVTAITGGSGAKWFTMSHEGSWTCND